MEKVTSFIKQRPIVSIIFLIIILKFTLFNSDNNKEIQNNSKTETNLKKENEVRELIKTEPLITSFNNEKDKINAQETLKYYENKLTNSFWTKFQSTDRYGRKIGTIEITFDQDAYERFVTKEGFIKTKEGTLMDYNGIKNGFEVYLNNNGAVPSGSGWVQKWEIICRKVEKNKISELKKQLLLNPN